MNYIVIVAYDKYFFNAANKKGSPLRLAQDFFSLERNLENI